MSQKSSAAGPPGSLHVSVGSSSMFLGHSVPIEVRDSRHRLVQRTAGANSLQLPAGLYEISAVLEDGRRHSAIVDVVAGQQTPVSLAADEAAAADTDTGTSLSMPAMVMEPRLHLDTGLVFSRQDRFTRRMYERMADDLPSDAAANVALVEVQGASLERETRTLRIFQCKPQIDAVPAATFAEGQRQLVTSLPISPQGGSPSGSCAVRIEVVAGRVRAPALITPQRTVANALQNMMATDHLMHAAGIADQAIHLLSSKYQDPTGAALGALILYKTGKLGQFASWVENLARSFDWLPDGKILLARLQADQQRPSTDMLQQCLRAAQQRPLYTECHALLLDLLRRWPGDELPAPRAEAVARLSALAPLVDRDSICFSHWLPTAEDL